MGCQICHSSCTVCRSSSDSSATELHRCPENSEPNYFTQRPNWLEMKQQLLVAHGSEEEKIENLKRLFLRSLNDKSRYYHRLKDIVKIADWKDFYHGLLSEVKGYNSLDYIAPFLIEEGEYDWLFRLVEKAVKQDSTDYRLRSDMLPHWLIPMRPR